MNDPDDLLQQLGALERDYDDAFPHEWEDVVRGERSADDVIAAREGIDDPQELQALAQVLQPLDGATRDGWVERLAATLAEPARVESAPEAEPAPEVEHAPEPTPTPDPTVVSLGARRRARLTWMTAMGGLLAAAALVLWLRPDDRPRPPSPSTLPSFALTVRNETVHEIRSDPATPGAIDRYQPSSRIHWVIRPERSVAPPLGLRVLAQAQAPADAERRLLDPGAVAVSDRGVLELQGTWAATLALPPGRWSLRLVVADPAALPDDLRAFDRGGAWTVSEPYVIDVLP